MRKLDAKEARFVAEYLVDLNVARAAMAAGYSATMAQSKAYQWVCDGKAKPHVFAAIEAGRRKVADRLEITAENVKRELARIGFSDIRQAVSWKTRQVTETKGKTTRKFYAPTVELIDSDQIDDDTAAAISEVSQTAHGVKLKFYDKRAALVDLGKHLGVFAEGPNITVPVNFIIKRTAISQEDGA